LTKKKPQQTTKTIEINLCHTSILWSAQICVCVCVLAPNSLGLVDLQETRQGLNSLMML